MIEPEQPDHVQENDSLLLLYSPESDNQVLVLPIHILSNLFPDSCHFILESSLNFL